MGDWPSANAICEASGFKVKQSRMVRQWDGAMVDRRFVDIRNPQDFVRGVPDRQDLPWARPESTDVFIAVPNSASTADATTTTADTTLVTADRA